MRELKILVAVLILSSILPSVLGAEPNRIISNSADWRDVYSVMLFGSLTQRNAVFLASDRHGSLLVDSIPSAEHVWVYSSRTVPFTTGFDSFLNTKGITTETFTYDNVNLALAREVDTTTFVIIDDAYGYNAISVAPYAVVSNSYVLLANENNVDELVSVLVDKGATGIIVYGHVPREVLIALADFDYEIINNDGDRFANNIEIVRRYKEISAAKQVILTNGEFIEQEIMSGKEPVIFIGRNNVPEIVRNYVQSSDITIGVLIGNELVNTATFIRRQIGISVFVKFARSARSAGASAVSQVEALDMFYLPVYSLNLAIDDLSYNRATGQLEVIMRNTENQAAYFLGTYTLRYPDGTVLTVGDAQPVFIEPNSFKTVTYIVDSLPSNSIVEAFVIYGESKNSLEFTIDEQFCQTCARQFSSIDIIDNCQINMTGLSYAAGRRLFYADIINVGPVDCYVDVELLDVVVAAEQVTYHLADVAFIESGEERRLKIKGELEQEDIIDNENVDVRVYYGQRENSLVHILERSFPLILTTTFFSAITIVSIVVLVIIIIIILLLGWRIAGRKKRNR